MVIAGSLAILLFMSDGYQWLALSSAGLVALPLVIILQWARGRGFGLDRNRPDFSGANGTLLVPRQFIFDGTGFQGMSKLYSAILAVGMLLTILGMIWGSLDPAVGGYRWFLGVFWIFIPLWLKWVVLDIWRAKDAELSVDHVGVRIHLIGDMDLPVARVTIPWSSVMSVDGAYYSAGSDVWEPCVRVSISGHWDFDSIDSVFYGFVHWDGQDQSLYVSGRLFRSDPTDIINTMNIYRDISAGNFSDHVQAVNGEWPSQEERQKFQVVTTERVKRGSATTS